MLAREARATQVTWSDVVALNMHGLGMIEDGLGLGMIYGWFRVCMDMVIRNCINAVADFSERLGGGAEGFKNGLSGAGLV